MSLIQAVLNHSAVSPHSGHVAESDRPLRKGSREDDGHIQIRVPIKRLLSVEETGAPKDELAEALLASIIASNAAIDSLTVFVCISFKVVFARRNDAAQEKRMCHFPISPSLPF